MSQGNCFSVKLFQRCYVRLTFFKCLMNKLTFIVRLTVFDGIRDRNTSMHYKGDYTQHSNDIHVFHRYGLRVSRCLVLTGWPGEMFFEMQKDMKEIWDMDEYMSMMVRGFCHWLWIFYRNTLISHHLIQAGERFFLISQRVSFASEFFIFKHSIAKWQNSKT